MRVAELIDVSGGIISIIGSGGKTTLMRTLAGQLPGTVILTTTTHIYPLDGLPLVTENNPAVIQRALQQNRVISIGTPGRNGKLTAPALSFDQLRQMARWVLVEADGSRSRHMLPTNRLFRWITAVPSGLSVHRDLESRSVKWYTVRNFTAG